VGLPPLLTRSIQSLVLNLDQYFFTQNNLVVLRDSHTITVIFLEIWIALIYMRNREKVSI
jgi:hypothetical protein